MKRYVAQVFILCLAIAFVGCEADTRTENGTEVDQQQVREAIESQNARFEQYVAEQQFDSLRAIYTSDGQLMAPNAPIASGDGLVPAFEGMAEMGVTGLQLQTMEVGAAEDFAYEVGSYTLQGPNGVEVDHGKYVVIWKMEDGEWKLHRDIFNSSVTSEGQGEAADTTQT